MPFSKIQLVQIENNIHITYMCEECTKMISKWQQIITIELGLIASGSSCRGPFLTDLSINYTLNTALNTCMFFIYMLSKNYKTNWQNFLIKVTCGMMWHFQNHQVNINHFGRKGEALPKNIGMDARMAVTFMEPILWAWYTICRTNFDYFNNIIVIFL